MGSIPIPCTKEKEMFALVAIVGIALVVSAKIAPVEQPLDQKTSGSQMPTAGTLTGIAKIIKSIR